MVSTNEVWDVFLTRKGDGHDEDEPPKAVTVRLPPQSYRYLAAMAEAADMSRNAMAVQLIAWGIGVALGQLPEEIRDSIENEVNKED